jgi:hypothetical protein
MNVAAESDDSSRRAEQYARTWREVWRLRTPLEAIMNKIEMYRTQLRALSDWEPFLLRESGLPGPRGNLELAHAVAAEGDAAQFQRFLIYTPDRAPANSPEEFLAFCGVLGLGKLLVEGQTGVLDRLRSYASDPRWRTREAVAMALQRLGAHDTTQLLQAVGPWISGNPLEKRAVAAALCEPRLLGDKNHARHVLHILDVITDSVAEITDRKSDGFKALRQGLGYCWSVSVAACPEEGKPLMEKWSSNPDPDVRWIMRENLKKHRLVRMDAAWVERLRRSVTATE